MKPKSKFKYGAISESTTALNVDQTNTSSVLNTDYKSSVTEHPWIQNEKKASNVRLGDIVITRVKQFSLMYRYKKKALRASLFKWLVSQVCLNITPAYIYL